MIDESGNHPEFPGPNMVHFRKDYIDYRQLATEMTIANENRHKIKQIGSDMNAAIFNGVCPVFPAAKKRICLQHIMERDGHKLDKLKATLPQKNSILAAIYGSEKCKTFQLGLRR